MQAQEAAINGQSTDMQARDASATKLLRRGRNLDEEAATTEAKVQWRSSLFEKIQGDRGPHSMEGAVRRAGGHQ